MDRPYRTTHLMLVVSSLCVSSALSPALANDPCVAVGSMVVCEGDQSDGVEVMDAGVETLRVRSLSADIVTSDKAGIGFYSNQGGPMTLSSDSRPFSIVTTGDDAPGIFIDSYFQRFHTLSAFTSGDITVTSSDDITTTGDYSYGIVVDTVTALIHSSQSVESRGGAVHVLGGGSIVTHGANANGVDVFQAVSAGALNGSAQAWGGNVSATGYDIRTHGDYAAGLNVRQNVSANGSVLARATGGTLSAANGGMISTDGYNASGVTANSFVNVSGSDALATTAGVSATSDTVETFGDLSAGIVVGVDGIANGKDRAEAVAEDVVATNSGLISTHGDASIGIGAGVGLTVQSALGDAIANSGRVEVNNDGEIVTRGADASGVLVQSELLSRADAATGHAIATMGDTEVNSNRIETSGEASDGIRVYHFATAEAALGTADAAVGRTTVNAHDVLVAGDYSSGILVAHFAQSMGATGVADSGDVVVNTTGEIAATGEDAAGIVVASVGLGADVVSGDVEINVLSGSVTGGSGDGIGIAVINDGSATITNHGAISALSGNAIVGALGDIAVENYGRITGNVALLMGANVFNNHATGVFETGDFVELGFGNALTNAGVLSPGGLGALQFTAVSGNFAQTATGQYAVDVDFATGASDIIAIGNVDVASLAGSVVANPIAFGPGIQHQFHILHALGGVSDDGFTAVDTAVVDYTVSFDPNGQDVYLGAVIDFRGQVLNPNQTAVANTFTAIQAAGASGAFEPVLNALLSVPADAHLGSIYDQLSPEIYGAQRTEAVFAAEQFSKALMSCRVADSGAYAAIREGECLWARARATDLDVEQTRTSTGANSRVGSFSAGVQVALASDWKLGVGVGYDLVSLSSTTGASSDGERTNVGAVVKYNPGPLLLAAGVSAGWGSHDTDRRFALGGIPAVQSKSDTDFVSGWLHAAYLLDQGGWYLKPQIDARVTEIDFGGVSGAGGGAAALAVAGARDTMVSVSPAIEVGTEFRFDSLAIWRPYLRAGVTWRDENALATQAAFVGGPAGVPGFVIATDVDDMLFDLGVGVDVIGTDGVVLSVQYDGRFAGDVSQNSFSLKGSVPF